MYVRRVVAAAVAAAAACGRGADAAADAAPGPAIAAAARVDQSAPLGPLRRDSLRAPDWGLVRVYRRAGDDAPAVLLLSGARGWDAAADAAARELADAGALVLGVDGRPASAEFRGGGACAYPADDLENLSQGLQQRLGRRRYTPPVLVGLGASAAAAYVALAQAPPNTFAGGVGVGFDPALPGARRPCPGTGALRTAAGGAGRQLLRPARALTGPWAFAQTPADSARTTAAVAPFAAAPGVAWVVAERGALAAAFARARPAAPAPPADAAVRDLPLTEVPAAAAPAAAMRDVFAVIVSGDGGWASIDRSVAGALAARGVPVVGWSSLQYLWRGSTPDSAARDLDRVLRHYAGAWARPRALLVGYSLGADVLPFMAARLPDASRAAVAGVALLAPSRTASFTFHVTDWVGGGRDDLVVAPEVARLRGRLPAATPVLCLYGADDAADSACPLVPAVAAARVQLPGGHHFGGDYAGLAARVLGAGTTTH